MRDPRLDALARVLVNYSTAVRPGQLVRLAGDPVGLPLIEALYEQVLKAGAHPVVRLAPGSLQELFYEHANNEQLKHVSPLQLAEIETIDASIGLWASTNTKSLSRVDPRKQGLASAARKPVTRVFFERAAKGELKWSGTQYPTAASAQDAEMSLAQYEDFVFSAGHLDAEDPVAVWQQISERQQKVVDYLNVKQHLHFQTPAGTDLHVDVGGMTWINCDGHENFPDGEVFTGPNLDAGDDSPSPGGVNGVVKYSFPAVHHGREVHDIELTFERGRVVDAKASKNLDFLLAMLDQDEGARRLGEIAIGTNYAITDY
ncbi:MAG: aminopeptidase, partial [Planctomycetota bacterium]